MILIKSHLKELKFNSIAIKGIKRTVNLIGNNFSSNSEPVKLSYQLTGESKDNANPIVIMHGFLGAGKNWNNISKTLYNSLSPKRQIFSLDARNHGESPHKPTHRIADLAGDVAEFHRQHKISKSIVIGHSMGGRAMMLFAIDHPEMIEKAIICDISATPCEYSQWGETMKQTLPEIKKVNLTKDLSLGNARKLMDRALSNVFDNKELRNMIMMNFYKDKDGNFAWRLNFDAFTTTEKLLCFPDVGNRKFDGPILFIVGTQSDHVTNADIPKLKVIFPNAQIEHIEAGHLVHIDNPKDFLRLVLNFINK